MSFGSYSGAAGALAEELHGIRNRQQTEHDEAKHKLRERQADDIETAIQNIQQNQTLSPEQKTKEIDAARQQLQQLYQPHEGEHLFNRLKKIFGGQQQPQSTNGQIELKPGMTLAEVLSAGSPAPAAPKTVGQPFKAEDGKFYILQMDQTGKISRQEVPYSEQSRLEYFKSQGLNDQQAQEAVEVEAGIKAKPVATTKPLKYDSKTDTVEDPNSGQVYSRDDVNKPETPEAVSRMFEGAKRVAKEKEDAATRRYQERLQMQMNAFNFAIQKGDHQKAQAIYDNSRQELVQSRLRLKTMEDNKEDALNGSQQAMLSLVANHIGMTLGAQKGARITRAVWDEAMESAPWISTVVAKSFHQDADGNYIFDGWKTGVTLTKEQIEQMVSLAHQKVDNLNSMVGEIKQEFPELDTGKGKGKGKTEPPPADVDEQIIKALSGKK